MAPEIVILVMIMVALTLYAILGGADFGAGVWEFNTALQASPKEQRLIYGAMGPVWEANHVWLIFALVGMFGAFPIAFAALCRALWLPLLLALLGIVFRGAGFVFHSYATGAVRQQAAWGAVFALASTATPFFLGACVGAIASGRLAVTARGDFDGHFVSGWISPLAVYSAFFAVAICAYLAAIYLTRDSHRADDAGLVRLWRQRALGSGIWLGILAIAGLALLATDAPDLWANFRGRAAPLVVLSVLGGAFSIWALWMRRFTGASLGAVVAVGSVVWGWGIAQFPMLVPPTISIDVAKAPRAVLQPMIWAIVAGSVLVVPSLGYLLLLFKGQRSAVDHAATKRH